VKDVIDVRENREHFRTQQAVRVGDDADARYAQIDAFFAHDESL